MDTSGRLEIRLARPEDTLEILRWRNDADTRSMSRNGAAIDEEQHKLWFSNALTDPWRILLIGTHLNEKLGLIRFDRIHDKLWETHIVIAPESRGKGLGRLFLDSALKYFYSEHPEASLLAVIKRCNVASKRLFSSLGFLCDADDGELFNFLLCPQDRS